jgi:hypothetical protein
MDLLYLLPIILLVLILVFCVSCQREGFVGAPIDGSYVMSEHDGKKFEDVEQNYSLMETQGFLPAAGVLDPNYPVLKDEAGTLFPFGENKCKPECCASSEYSCNNGCVCMTAQQRELLKTRGGNRTRVGNNF